ncbi:hypothetical protein JWG45_13305 [Leptospira sp. 201903070]|uniref:Lipoprotein n=1 Tax=Leptospira ainlahdjerensis TaxID=2810033 RepID=A0ABS2UDU8_9LEPT|nr:hypothetical protein [Leptospira ainlahdjerensis]MBM9578128.1 hypothetical protein [Leptospira ainlahdjerensis]
MKYALSILPLFLTLQCYLHHANINGDGFGAKSLIPFQSSTSFQGNVAVRVDFDPSGKETAIEDMKRKGLNVTVSTPDIESYYSPEILSQFRKSPLFLLNPNAQILIRIRSSVEEVKPPVLSVIAFLLTAGLFPMIERTNGRIEFEIYEEKTNLVLKSYKYPIEHRSIFGFAPVVLGPIIPAFSERFDHSQNKKNFAIMRVAFQQFEKDLSADLAQSKEFNSHFLQGEPHRFAFVSLAKTTDQGFDFFSDVYSTLEKSFLKHGIFLVERKRLDQVISEIQLSLSGITNNSRLQLGRLLDADRLILMDNFDYSPSDSKAYRVGFSFSIRCVDVQTGKIIWSEHIQERMYSDWNKSSSYQKERVVSKLIATLRERGELL